MQVLETSEGLLTSAGGARGALSEAVLSRDMSHPNIIQARPPLCGSHLPRLYPRPCFKQLA